MDNEKIVKEKGQKYSNLVISEMRSMLDIKEEDKKQEEIMWYGLSIDKGNTIINYLISWGGPSYRLQIDLDSDNDVVSIKPQYQDWFTQWVTMETTEEQEETLKEFVDELYLEEYINC